MLRLSHEPYVLRFARPAKTSRGALTERPILLLRAWDTDDPAIVGWGECGPLPGLSRDDRPTFAAEVAEVCDVINAGYLPTPADLVHLPSFAFGWETALRDLAAGGRRCLWDTPFSRGEGGLFRLGLPDGFLTRLTRRDYGPRLAVSYIGRLDQIHFKVYAAADRAGYHVDDLRALGPTDEEMEKAARWAMTHDVSEGFRLIVKSMLRQLGYDAAAANI